MYIWPMMAGGSNWLVETGGLSWVQTRKLIHGLVNKGRVLGMDLVEIAPAHDVGNTTMIHAERLLCNFIGACVRAGYYTDRP